MANIPFLNNAYFAGKVGIGTNSPSEKLEVDGNIKLTGNLNVGGYISPNDESGNLSIFGGNDTTNDAQILLHGSSNYWGSLELNYGYDAVNSFFKISQGANEHLRITNGGKVGIGTTSPSDKLEVYGGNLIVNDGTSKSRLRPSDLYMQQAGVIKAWLRADGNSYLNGGNLGIGTTSPAYILDVVSAGTATARLKSAGTGAISLRYENGSGFKSAAVVDNNGLYRLDATNISLNPTNNVGIGTTSPSQKLEVAGNVKLDGDNRHIYFGGNNTFIGERSNSTELELRGGGNSTAQTVYIDNSGSIGVGTSNPSQKLEVVGNIQATGARSISSSFDANHYMRIESNSSGGILKGTDGGVITTLVRTYGDSYFNGGNVGIGTTSPSTKLHVVGTGSFTGQVTIPATPVASTDAASKSYVDAHGGGLGPFLPIAGGTMTGDINFNDGIEARFGNSADLRLYHNGTNSNIENFAGTLQIIQNLDDGDISFKSDNGSGGTTEYFRLDGGSTMNVFSKPTWQGDGVKSFYGNSQDLQIYHDGSNSYVSDTGTGSLILTGTDLQLKSAGDEFFMYGAADGQVALYHNGTKKFETGSTGVTVIGSATATTFLGDLNGTINTATTAVTKANATNDTTVATTAFVQNLIGTIPAGLVFQGTWNAATNTPTLTSGSGTTGHFYIVSTDGSTNLDGITDWKVGDWAVFVEQGASDQWEKVDNSSVLDGSGTGGSVAGWAGSGTSNTLTNAPITFSGNNTTFAGDISIADKLIHSGDTNTYLSFSGADNIKLVASGKNVLHAHDNGNLYLYGNNGTALTLDGSQNATFAGRVMADTHFQSSDANATLSATGTGNIYLRPNGYSTTTGQVHINTSGNATFTGNISFGDSHFIGDDADDNLLIQGSASENVIIRSEDGLYFRTGGNNTRLTINSSGKVGIGTTSPEAKLTIKGDALNTNQPVRITNSVTDTHTGLFLNNTGSTVGEKYGMQFGGYNQYSIGGIFGVLDSVSGSTSGDITFDLGNGTSAGSLIERMRITHEGNVGIGTTSPNRKLSVYQSSSSLVADFRSASGNNSHISLSNNASTADQVRIGSASSSLVLSTNYTERMRITDSGNVGIGTTSPGVKLDVSGQIRSNDSFLLQSGTTAIGSIRNQGGALDIRGDSTRDVSLGSVTSPQALFVEGTNGNVGIGTTSPSEKLHVKGNILVEDNDSTDTVAQIGNSGDDGWLNLYANGTSKAFIGANAVSYFNGGNVGIGTTSPSEELEVSGDISIKNKNGSNPTDAGSLYFKEAGSDWGSSMYGFRINSDGSSNILKFQGAAFAVVKDILTLTRDTGRVGIGTNSPTYKLHVQSPDANDDVVYIHHDNAAQSSGTLLKVRTDAGDSNGYTLLDVQNNSGSALFVRGDRKVGIGTTSPDTILHVKGSTDSTEVKIDTNDNALGDNALIKFNGERAQVGWIDAAVTLTDGGGNKDIKLKVNTGSIFLQTNNTSRLSVIDGGNVGIGTTSPSQKLDVNGSINVSSNVFAEGFYGNRLWNSDNSALRFATNNTERARIDGNGNLGIGTTNPTNKLHIQGSQATVYSSTDSGGQASAGTTINNTNTSGNTNNFSQLLFTVGTNNNSVSRIVAIRSGSDASDLAFVGKSAAGVAEYMRIKSGGNVGIGTTSPGSSLEVLKSASSTTISEARISSLVTGGYGGQANLWLRTSTYGNAMLAFGPQVGSSTVASSASGKISYNTFNRTFTVTADSNALLTLGGSNDRVGINQTSPQYTLDVTGNGRFTSTVTATNFINSSDERLKENIEEVCNNNVEVNWKTFNFKAEKEQKRYGVIAQELEKTNPEFVREDSKGFKSVAYIDLLIAKIAELEARIQKLEK